MRRWRNTTTEETHGRTHGTEGVGTLTTGRRWDWSHRWIWVCRGLHLIGPRCSDKGAVGWSRHTIIPASTTLVGQPRLLGETAVIMINHPLPMTM